MTLEPPVTGKAGSVALHARSISKTFGSNTVLDGIELSVGRGTIHALLGGNGSGKSTLIKCLAGVYHADRGEVVVGGASVPAAEITPRRAREIGLRFVHQDLALFDDLTVAENIALYTGFPLAKGNRIRWGPLHRQVRDLLEEYDIHAREQDLLGTLRPSQKTMVAVARALAGQKDSAYVLLLDEPTATLPEKESRELMQALRLRADLGQTILLVSHRLGEIEEVADQATVFQDGRVSARPGRSELTAQHISQLLSCPGLQPGPAPAPAGPARHPERPGPRAGTGHPPGFRVDGLSAGQVTNVSFTVAGGEIVGLAGLAGAGKSTLLRAAFGSRRLSGGQMHLGGQPYAPRHPQDAINAGVGYVPEDRHREGLFLDLSVRENFSVTVLSSYWRRFFLDHRQEHRDTGDLIEQHSVRTTSAKVPIAALSGGNQQKVVLGKWVRRDPSLLLLDEPTQGVDVTSRNEIYQTLRQLAAGGCGILVASTDLDELLSLCNRILVLEAGAVTREFHNAAATTRHDLASALLDNSSRYATPES